MLLLKSFCEYVPEIIKGELLGLFKIATDMLDSGMVAQDSKQVLVAIELSHVLSNFMAGQHFDQEEKEDVVKRHKIYFCGGDPTVLAEKLSKLDADVSIGYMSATPDSDSGEVT